MSDPRLIGLTPLLRQASTSANTRARVGVLERTRQANPGSGSGSSVPDATPAVKGKLQLAGDLEGTADSPSLKKGSTTEAGAIGVWDIRDFGATEGADILAALNAAQAAMPSSGGILEIPLFRVNLSNTWTMMKPIQLRGLGTGAGTTEKVGGIFNTGTWGSPSTQITWTKGSAGSMIVIGPDLKSWGLDAVNLHGNDIATVGFSFDCAQYGDIGTLSVHRLAAGGVGFDFHTDSATDSATDASRNTMFITARHLIGRCPTLVRFRGSENLVPYVAANACHISIDKIVGVFGVDGSAANGVHFDDCDNNTLHGVYVNRWNGTGPGTGYGIYYEDRARSNVIVHCQPSAGGVGVVAPAVSGNTNRIVHYDRENAQPAPAIATGATLHWAESSRVGTGIYINSKQAAPINASHYVHRVEGDTGVEYVAQGRSAPSTSYFLARAFQSDGTTAVNGQYYASGAGPSINFGSGSNHEVVFRQNSTRVFALNTSTQAQFASGKRIGFNVDPAAAIHFGADTTAAGGIQFGSDASAIGLYRQAANALRLDNALLGINADPTHQLTFASSTSATDFIQFGTGNPVNLYRSATNELRIGDSTTNTLNLNLTGAMTSSATVAAANVLYMSAHRSGEFNLARVGGTVFQMFNETAGNALSTVTQPTFKITAAGAVSWGPGGTTATDHTLSRVDTAWMRFSQGLRAAGLVAENTAGTGYLQLSEQSAGPAGLANAVRIFTEDNGAGKTRLMVQFPTGTAQQLAIEA